MLNRQWLNSLSNKELARLINESDSCDYCIRSINGDCESEFCQNSEYCEEGIEEWLEKEHKESMPKLEVGDILRFRFKDGILVYTASVVGEGYMYSLEYGLAKINDSNYRIFEAWRFNGKKLDTIWRADND